jgi:Cellulose binding domain
MTTPLRRSFGVALVCVGAMALTPAVADAATVLPAPTGLTVQHVSDTRADLSWDFNEFSGGDVVQREVNGSWQQFAGVPYSPLALTNLTPATTYTLRVFATPIDDNFTASPPSAPITFTTLSGPDTTPPSKPPTPFSGDITTTVADVFWAGSTDNVQVIGYYLQQLVGGTWTTIRTITPDEDGSVQTLTGLTADTSYTFAVIAFDAAGNLSARSDPVTFTTLPTTPNPTCVVQLQKYNPGFVVAVDITNTTASVLTGWTVQFTLPANTTISSSFSGVLSRNGSVGTITAPSYAPSIAQGRQLFPGFEGSVSPFTPPSGFTLNGIPCTGP